MRQKSLPQSIRYAQPHAGWPHRSVQAPGMRPRHLPDWLATLVMALAIPAMILPLFAVGTAHTPSAITANSVDQAAVADDRRNPRAFIDSNQAQPAAGSGTAPSTPGSNLGQGGGADSGNGAPQGSEASSASPSSTFSKTPAPEPGATSAPTPTPRRGRATPTPAATVPAATAPPSPVVALHPPTTTGSILISAAQLAALPMSGAAWDSLKRAADAPAGTPNLTDMNQSNNVAVLAKALVYARTGDLTYRAQVLSALHAVIGSEAGGETLALGRELAAYVLAADLIGLRSVDPAFDSTFRGWLAALVARPMADGNSLRQTHERRPNNWGTHAGASRAAVAAYLGDAGELARVAQVFKGWLGDRASYAGFSFGELSWQADASQPVGINPAGSTIGGHSVDGVLPDDQRRTGGFIWPPPCGNYPYGALDGALLQAEILWRAGYDTFNWQNQALLRAELWLRSTGCAPSGDNLWQAPLLDARYHTSFWNGAPVPPGKNVGWTSWLYGR